MKIIEVKIIQTSQKGQSILLIRTEKEQDQRFAPAMQQQVPTDLAEYIKRLIEVDQRISSAVTLSSEQIIKIAESKNGPGYGVGFD